MFDADPNPPGPAERALSPEDAAVVEALFAAGFDPSSLPQAGRVRGERLLALLAGLEAAPVAAADRRVLVDLTLARAVRAGRLMGPGSDQGMQLTEADARAVDAMAEAGQDAARVSAELAARAKRIDAISALVRTPGSSATSSTSSSLVDSIMAKVERLDSDRSGRMKLRPERGVGVVPMLARWRDVLSTAAVLMVATSVFWTLAGAASHYSRRASCLSGLGSVASAMTGYANDNRDGLPMASASMGGGTWWDVQRDKPTSNSSNLFTLARKGYTALSTLACAGNPDACRSAQCEKDAVDWANLSEVSYSYQIMFGQHRPAWNSASRNVVLADRSPVIRRAILGETIRPDENSMSHDGIGQNVLFSDGAAQWLRSPILSSGDNIWLPKPMRVELRMIQTPTAIEIHGVELPRSPDDAFVGP